MQSLNGDPRSGIQKILKKNSEKNFRASNATQELLGRQMPLGGIGASNATQEYWGVKCHPGVLGRQMPPRIYWGVKGQGRQRARKPQGVKNQGRQKALYG